MPVRVHATINGASSQHKEKRQLWFQSNFADHRRACMNFVRTEARTKNVQIKIFNSTSRILQRTIMSSTWNSSPALELDAPSVAHHSTFFIYLVFNNKIILRRTYYKHVFYMHSSRIVYVVFGGSFSHFLKSQNVNVRRGWRKPHRGIRWAVLWRVQLVKQRTHPCPKEFSNLLL